MLLYQDHSNAFSHTQMKAIQSRMEPNILFTWWTLTPPTLLQGYFTCDHLPFFELGSCHHKQYLVNLLLPSLPLGETVDQYRGLGPLSRLTVYVSPGLGLGLVSPRNFLSNSLLFISHFPRTSSLLLLLSPHHFLLSFCDTSVMIQPGMRLVWACFNGGWCPCQDITS